LATRHQAQFGRLEAVDVGTAGDRSTRAISSIPGQLVDTGPVESVGEAPNSLVHGVVDGQMDLAVVGQIETNPRRRIEL